MKSVTFIESRWSNGVSSAGKNYKFLELVYSDAGQNKTSKIFQTHLNANPALAEKIKGLKNGDKVNLHFTKDGNYWTLSSITDQSEDARQSTTTATSGTREYTNIGAQVGNALNVAAITLGPCKIEQLEERAMAVVGLHKKLTDFIKSASTTTTTTSTPTADEFDEF